MIDMHVDPLLALFLYPFLGTGIIAGIISLVGRGPSKTVLISAATGIGTAWVCAFVLGIPSFALTFDSSSIAHIVLAGLFLGALLDHFLPKFYSEHRVISSSIDLTFAAAVILWIRVDIDLWSILIFLTWGIILISSRRHSYDARIPLIMTLVTAIGLATIAWIGDILVDRNLAFGIGSTVLGFTLWLIYKHDLPIGFSFYWSTFTALLLIALRIIEANPLMSIPIFLLGFIFFADSILLRINARFKLFSRLATPLLVGALSLLPIILASASALVATTLFNY